MRAFLSNRRVAVSEADIQAFIARWPSSGLDELKGVAFVYEESGDLVDIYYRNGSSERWDGPALTALSEDAQKYLNKRVAADTGKRQRKLALGDRVKVSEGSGLDSGCVGVILPWSTVPMRKDGSGIPDLPGYYNVPDRTNEYPLKLGDGRTILMFRNRLSKV